MWGESTRERDIFCVTFLFTDKITLNGFLIFRFLRIYVFVLVINLMNQQHDGLKWHKSKTAIFIPPWSWVYLEYLRVTQRVEEILHFYGTRLLVTIFGISFYGNYPESVKFRLYPHNFSFKINLQPMRVSLK
jgi:hypothetical protein